MGLAQLQHWARAKMMHDRVHVSHSRPADILLPDVNIVHLQRCSPVHPKHVNCQAEELGVVFKTRVLANTREPHAAATRLTQSLDVAEVREWLQEDIANLINIFGEQLGYSTVSTKLEVLGLTACPRFHADHVGVRALVTYTGPGTLFVENRHVMRRWLWGRSLLDGSGGGVAIAAVDVSAARQAAAPDVLFLKGHAAPGNYGMGAVHRSPDMCVEHDGVMFERHEGGARRKECAGGAGLAVRAESSRGVAEVSTSGIAATGDVVARSGAGVADWSLSGQCGLRLLLTVDDAVDCVEQDSEKGK